MRTIHRDIVGAFIFSKDNKVLLGQSVKGGVYKNEWIVPGGGVESGETNLQAVQRETQEEVGIDITNEQVEAIEGEFTGSSQKILRDTGEKVVVEMTFHDYKVTLQQAAKDVKVTLEDDLSQAQWFTKQELLQIQLAPPTKRRLQEINFM